MDIADEFVLPALFLSARTNKVFQDSGEVS